MVRVFMSWTVATRAAAFPPSHATMPRCVKDQKALFEIPVGLTVTDQIQGQIELRRRGRPILSGSCHENFAAHCLSGKGPYRTDKNR